jgi:hypothetical protein
VLCTKSSWGVGGVILLLAGLVAQAFDCPVYDFALTTLVVSYAVSPGMFVTATCNCVADHGSSIVDRTVGDDYHQLTVDANSTSCIHGELIEFIRPHPCIGQHTLAVDGITRKPPDSAHNPGAAAGPDHRRNLERTHQPLSDLHPLIAPRTCRLLV